MGGWKVIIVSALSLSLRDKERFRDWEIERAWQYSVNLWVTLLKIFCLWVTLKMALLYLYPDKNKVAHCASEFQVSYILAYWSHRWFQEVENWRRKSFEGWKGQNSRSRRICNNKGIHSCCLQSNQIVFGLINVS